ncbi:MAG: chromosomal replication initiator protein DnaA [Bacteroidetes bacterium]|nr:chromosomal replication initiator protein DnaA [Bacteroidota bacterium]
MEQDLQFNNTELNLLSKNETKLITKKSNQIKDTTHTPQTYWKECLKVIKDNIDSQAYNTWFEPLQPLSYIDNKFKIKLPSEWFREWLDTHYYDLINKTLKRVINNDVELIYDVVVIDSNGNEPTMVLYPAQRQPNVDNSDAFNKRLDQSKLKPMFTFDNFVAGDSNITAINAAKAVAKELNNTRFNPLVLFGGVGLGKTHLANAIGNYVFQNYPNQKVMYISSDTFTNDFIAQVTKKDNNITAFNDIYKNIDFLIVDDIQFFAGKKETQDKFFHIFNSLYLEGKKIVLTSDRPSSNLKSIDNRLASRFIAGLNVEIKTPDYKHRKDIINFKSRIEGIQLPEEIVDYIALNINTNIRAIEGVLLNLSFRTTYCSEKLTIELVNETISKIASEKQNITIEEIIDKVSNQYNIKAELIESKSRKQEIALARQIAMKLARKHTELSLKTIGEKFNRNHATVIHACLTIENLLDTDTKIKEQYEAIETLIKNR